MSLRLLSLTVFLLLCVFCPDTAASAGNPPADTLVAGSEYIDIRLITTPDTLIRLGHRFVVEGTEEVTLNGRLLNSGREYTLNPAQGTIRLLMRGDSLGRPGVSYPATVRVRYVALALNVPDVVQHRVSVAQVDSASRDTQHVAVTSRPFQVDDLFGGNLKKSGSIVRGLSVGTNRDFSLTSGLRLQMSGSLADNVDIVAALTDENTPIQPEGTTQTLQEIDKVFVELRGKDVRATLGDFSLTAGSGTFGMITRKVQGARGEGRAVAGGLRGDVMLAGATTRGKFTSNQFSGIDGVQGPYRLRGQNNERDIIVIAGTERVYVDGEQMTRGDVNDYIIDYGIAEITFTPKRLVSQYSRITVDFEYSDRQFNRTLLGGTATVQSENGTYSVATSYIREQDDRDSPLDVVLTDADREILRRAGNDRSMAVSSGVVTVGAGRGQYRDSLAVVGDTTIVMYVYAPSDTANAIYAVTFSDVGAGRGSYRRVAGGHYVFAGIGGGAYEPVRLLPMPQSHSLADIAFKGRPLGGFSIDADLALSRFDANSYSAIGDERNGGLGASLAMALEPANVSLAGANLGAFGFTLKERYRNDRFVPIDRIDHVEFDRAWGTSGPAIVREELREATLQYLPDRRLVLGASLGSVDRGDAFTSTRTTASVRITDSLLPSLDWMMENVRTENGVDAGRGEWTHHVADAAYRWGLAAPGLRVEREWKELRATGADSLLEGGYRYTEVAPRISLAEFSRMTMSVDAGFRAEDSVLAGRFQHASNSVVTRWSWELREWNTLSSSLTLASRSREFDRVFRLRGNQDNTALLVRSQTRFAPLRRAIDIDLFYEAASERSARMERVFQAVPRGTGNYVYDGDVNGNLVRDEGDFRPVRFDGEYIALLVPSEQLVPVSSVKASTRLRFSGRRLVEGNAWWQQVLASLSSETYARVEEKSTDPETGNIYALRLNRFLNDSTTMSGANLVSQDIFLFEQSPEFSLRFRYAQRHGLTQLSAQRERSYTRERSVRLRCAPLKEIGLEIEAAVRDDNLTANPSGYRERRVSSDVITSDWSYRPEQSIEIGFVLGGGSATNADSTRAYLNSQSFRLVYAIVERGQIRGELSREEARVSGGTLRIPYELTGGRFAGIAWLWRINAEYRLTGFLQMSLSYDGRSEGSSEAVHAARGEVRAFF